MLFNLTKAFTLHHPINTFQTAAKQVRRTQNSRIFTTAHYLFGSSTCHRMNSSHTDASDDAGAHADLAFATQCIHADALRCSEDDGLSSAIAPPISMSTTFEVTDGKFVYSRDTTPTRSRVESVLAALHGPQSGAVVYSSGLSAIYAALVHYAPKRVAIDGGYHGTHQVLDLLRRTNTIESVVCLDEESLSQLEKGDVVWLESPTNPTCSLMDVKAFVSRASAVGAVVIIDSTFAPPPLWNPFDLGVDMVMHSCTKYLAGHSDCLSGALIVQADEAHKALLQDRCVLGSVPGSLEVWLLLRSLRTLRVRVRHQSATAATVATWLDSSEAKDLGVELVYHASLSTSPDYELAKTQMPGGCGAMFAMNLKDPEIAQRLPAALRLFKDATSLGAVESLIEWRRKYDQNISPKLLRVSIGLEEPEDLINDLRAALKKLKA